MKTAPSRRHIAAALSSVLFAVGAQAALVFQADFNGAGSGTGGAADIVTFGGTGVITNLDPQISNATASITSGTSLADGSGSFLRINDQGIQSATRAAGVRFTPNSAANSFESWYSNTSGTLGYDTLNGGFDFLFRSTGTSFGATNTYRFLDLNALGSTGFRLALFSSSTDRLTLALIQNGGAGDIARANSAAISFTANTTYRIAATVFTNSSGIVTVNLYMAEGDTAIDTSSATHRIATATSSGALDAGNSISSSFSSVDGFNFGLLQNSVNDTKTLDLDSFRIYNAVPASFEAVSIPEPGSYALIVSLFAAGCCVAGRRRR